MSKVIEGAEVHGSMFKVWRHCWVTAVGAKRTSGKTPNFVGCRLQTMLKAIE
jgi:hypothetical protein